MIYLDNSATTPVDPEVLTAFTKVNQNFWGNPSSLHAFGARAEQSIFIFSMSTGILPIL